MKHRHAEVIKAWADGAEIEVRTPCFNWFLCTKNNPPAWDDESVYRVKPTPKPDVVEYAYLVIRTNPVKCYFINGVANIKLTFDGETSKLKAAEVIE